LEIGDGSEKKGCCCCCCDEMKLEIGNLRRVLRFVKKKDFSLSRYEGVMGWVKHG
jgi:hypothetical protein